MNKKYIADQQDLWQRNEFKVCQGLARLWLDVNREGNVTPENVQQLQKDASVVIEQINAIIEAAIKAAAIQNEAIN